MMRYTICTEYGERVTIYANTESAAVRQFKRKYPSERIIGVTLMNSGQ